MYSPILLHFGYFCVFINHWKIFSKARQMLQLHLLLFKLVGAKVEDTWIVFILSCPVLLFTLWISVLICQILILLHLLEDLLRSKTNATYVEPEVFISQKNLAKSQLQHILNTVALRKLMSERI